MNNLNVENKAEYKGVEKTLTNTIEMVGINNEPDFDVPIEGTLVDTKSVRRAGEYILSPNFRSIIVRGISQYLCKKSGTNQFYTIKILPMKRNQENTYSDLIAREILHTEYSLLTLLSDVPDIVKVHTLFKDCVPEELYNGQCFVYTGKIIDRICMVLDCYTPPDHSSNYINLQHFVIQQKRLSEKLTITIFRNVLLRVQELHKRNIVHRDLKLGNILYDKATHKILLFNFGLGKYLLNENCLLSDQKGSPAYISPDVINGKPYTGKPSDMWALGVLLYAMLFGQFPFHDTKSETLFDKIRAGDFTIPMVDGMNIFIIELIKGLLTLEPSKRFTVERAIDQVNKIVKYFRNSSRDDTLQVVPNVEDSACTSKSLSKTNNLNRLLQPDRIKIKFYSVNKNENIYRSIPVQQIGQDARAITASEMMLFTQFLQRASRPAGAATMTNTAPAVDVHQVPEYQPNSVATRQYLTQPRRRIYHLTNIPSPERIRGRPTRSERRMRHRERDRQRNLTYD